MEVVFLKKSWLIIGLFSISVITGCQNDQAGDGPYKKSGNTLNVNDNDADLYREVSDKNVSEDFGYVRHQKSPILGDRMSNDHYKAIDREKLADAISMYSTDLPNVNDVATLVTDEEVLVIYDTDSDDPNLTADQVKKSAMSFVPRWYHVYVSDNFNLRNTAESYSQLDSNSKNAEDGINKLIKEMIKSPQGKEVVNEENANGETKGEKTNENISENQ